MDFVAALNNLIQGLSCCDLMVKLLNRFPVSFLLGVVRLSDDVLLDIFVANTLF